MKERVLRARWIQVTPDRRVEGGGLLVRAGRVERVLGSAQAVRRAGLPVVDLGPGLVTPGTIDAHAHLELGALEGQLPGGPRFGEWVGELVRRRALLAPPTLEAGARAGAERLLAGGTTTVADVDTTGAGARGLRGHPIRAWTYREVLDAQDPERTAAALASVRRAPPARARRVEGLSPHAPFTVSPALFEGLAPIVRRRRLPLTMHWSETREEIEWLRRGSGPLAPLLGPSPRASGLDLLERAGLLRAPLSLVHGNYPEPDELRRLARAGAVVVHCPGSHEFFERPPFPLDLYRAAGVPVALGTDSLASNSSLAMAREMQRLRLARPDLSPSEVWTMVTVNAARALGAMGAPRGSGGRAARGPLGVLAPGACADLVLHGLPGNEADPLDALTHGAGTVLGVWLDGRRVPEAPTLQERGAERPGRGTA